LDYSYTNGHDELYPFVSGLNDKVLNSCFSKHERKDSQEYPEKSTLGKKGYTLTLICGQALHFFAKQCHRVIVALSITASA
jgi:hypothetical protein